jgi:hypothetical protein
MAERSRIRPETGRAAWAGKTSVIPHTLRAVPSASTDSASAMLRGLEYKSLTFTLGWFVLTGLSRGGACAVKNARLSVRHQKNIPNQIAMLAIKL